VGQQISAILAEDGGDQTSITQTSRLEIVQSQFGGLLEQCSEGMLTTKLEFSGVGPFIVIWC
jgi:Fe-S cluster biogenesis protein NfuA